MRNLLAHLRTLAQSRVQDWIRRRQGPDRDPVELTRNRIYILPTRLGLAYAGMLFAMLLGGMNYNNNLGLGLTFLLVSLGFVTMHHCHGTLRGLSLRLLATEPAFVGQKVGFRLLLENAAVAPRPPEVREVTAPRPRLRPRHLTLRQQNRRQSCRIILLRPATIRRNRLHGRIQQVLRRVFGQLLRAMLRAIFLTSYPCRTSTIEWPITSIRSIMCGHWSRVF